MKKALLVVVLVVFGVAVIALIRPAEVDLPPNEKSAFSSSGKDGVMEKMLPIAEVGLSPNEKSAFSSSGKDDVMEKMFPIAEVGLSPYEKSIFSFSGEDGVIEKIFQIIEPTTKFAVEFGAADGVRGSNTRNLILNHGWSSLQMEGDKELAAQLVANYKDYPEVTCLQVWIYPGNIEILFEENGVPKDLDLLIIDIDSNDYYVWKAIHTYKPKVVMIEYNAMFPPPQLAVVDFHPMNYWDGSDYFGASIQSYYELGKRKGYELIYCNNYGTNLFFVDKKYYNRFEIRDNSPEKLYKPPGYGIESGSRAPNGRGFLPFEQSKPELIWKELKIRKKFVKNR